MSSLLPASQHARSPRLAQNEDAGRVPKEAHAFAQAGRVQPSPNASLLLSRSFFWKRISSAAEASEELEEAGETCRQTNTILNLSRVDDRDSSTSCRQMFARGGCSKLQLQLARRLSECERCTRAVEGRDESDLSMACKIFEGRLGCLARMGDGYPDRPHPAAPTRHKA
ncbi:hypothetical protein IE81DRAFT_45784 [Ceraceosorus guamensis]|uniref:Uncharacterized protein n=1 Tax=Ceraceosorus guamensis TaxID=1522189 RepID=A0A316W2E5_9BASI|nr:hypothetical protein IE81DRAFT_45784 [Ceraceosorus guamensis]PWN44067.1 hypothetical protein IE81DRAFT_45784 [Ceraceosorus guamensis]